MNVGNQVVPVPQNRVINVRRVSVVLSQSAFCDRVWLEWIFRVKSAPCLSFFIDAIACEILALRVAAISHRIQSRGFSALQHIALLAVGIAFFVSTLLRGASSSIQPITTASFLLLTVTMCIRSFLLIGCHFLFASHQFGDLRVSRNGASGLMLANVDFCRSTALLHTTVRGGVEYDEEVAILNDGALDVGWRLGGWENPYSGWPLLIYVLLLQCALHAIVGTVLVGSSLFTPMQAACATMLIYETLPLLWYGHATRSSTLHTLARIIICCVCCRLGAANVALTVNSRRWAVEFGSMALLEVVCRVRSIVLVPQTYSRNGDPNRTATAHNIVLQIYRAFENVVFFD